MRPQVVVVGDALLDVHVTPATSPRPGADVPGAVRLQPGGQGANIAVRLARRGVNVRLACALGDDTSGTMIRNALAADGVEVAARHAEVTGTVVVLLDAAGERTMVSQRVPLMAGLDLAVTATGAVWLVVSGYALLEREAHLPPAGAIRAVAGCALEPEEAAGWFERLAGLRPHLVILNLDEARTLVRGDVDPLAASRELGARLGSLVVVTHAAGAAAVIAGEDVEVAAEPADPVMDTTGAGDGFAAALIGELLPAAWPPSAERLSEAMREAAGVARRVAGVVGAQGRVEGEKGGTLST